MQTRDETLDDDVRDEIEVGRSFPLTVVRVWTRELEPDPWNDAALAPLTVRLEEASRREDAVFMDHHIGGVRETVD